MAVYKQTYTPYDGPLRRERWRFAILMRYSFLVLFESRLLVMFFALCFIPPLLAGGILHANHNMKTVETLWMVGTIVQGLPVDSAFFNLLFRTQAFLSFLLVTFAAPGLVSDDIANNALSVYLSKPFSRAEYVIGRLAVLMALASAVTWIPALALVGVQTDLAGWAWLRAHYRLAVAFVLAYWLWIIAICLLGIAVSALVKWRPLATGALLAVFFAGAGLGVLMNQMLQLETRLGLLLSLDSSISLIFSWLIDGVTQRNNVPAWNAAVWLSMICLACTGVLWRKLRA